MNKLRRKRILPPPMPEPEQRIAELKCFVTLLAEFIDYDILDVYDSVFYDRVDAIMDTVHFGPEQEEVWRCGEDIIASGSTKCRKFMRFFILCIQFIEGGYVTNSCS